MRSAVLLYIADDWVGLYIDGKLKLEDHSISAADALMAAGINVHYRDMSDSEMMNCPEELP